MDLPAARNKRCRHGSLNGAEKAKAVEPALIRKVIHNQSPKLRHVILLVKCLLTLWNK
jgi:hypothetical protein